MPRLTSHGEVVFEPVSSMGRQHNFWGDAANWWPGPIQEAPKNVGCGTCSQPPPVQHASLDAWLETAKAQSSDVNEHLPVLKELAVKCDTVVELSRWNKPALLAFAAAKPKKLVSVCFGNKADWPAIKAMCNGTVFDTINAEQQRPVVPQASDLLFIDTWHQADVLYDELSHWAPLCNHYIVIHCTSLFGETGDDGKPGVLPAIRRYLMEHQKWTVIRRYHNNNGLMVLSCKDEDKQQPPGMLRKALNFTKALAQHAKDGAHLVSDEVWEKRLEACTICEYRFADSCGKCGCPVEAKTSWASSRCPDSPPRWTEV